nr:hypothetical protein [Tanacetum cinerariifolium]
MSPGKVAWDVSGTKTRSGFTGVKSVAGLSPQPSRVHSRANDEPNPQPKKFEGGFEQDIDNEGEKDRRDEDGDSGVS